ncbi:cobalamin B12-binding domain-containing protein [Persicimonas caeni]|nr:cobalamin-dependent protein [Persicimonas caeni]
MDSASRTSSSRQPNYWQSEYIAAALAGDRRRAWQVVSDALDAGLSVASVYKDVLAWAQAEIGDCWADSEISVAQEHMASAVTQSVVARLYAYIESERSRGCVLLGGVEGEEHVLPAQLAADLLELEGWNVAFLGTNIPSEDFLKAIEDERPDVVGLSLTMAPDLPTAVTLIRDIRKRFGDLPIVLGGRAAAELREVAEDLDIEICDDLETFRREV